MARNSSLSQRIGNDNLVIGLSLAIPQDRIAVWQEQFEAYGAKRFPRALQFALNRVARDAQKGIGEAIDRVIDRPVMLSRVTDTGRSSVLTKGKGLTSASDTMDLSDVSAGVYVQDKQSAWFKFLLGEHTRLPGDVGPSEKHISIPIWSNLTRLQGIQPTTQGNLPVHALRTLARRQQRYDRVKADSMPDGPEKDALYRNRKKDGQYHATFYGRPKGVFGEVSLGWWDRPNRWLERKGPIIQTGPNKGRRRLEMVSDGRPHLLILDVDVAHYDPILADGWNDAVLKAAEHLDEYMQAELDDRLAWQGRHDVVADHRHDAAFYDTENAS